MAARHAARVEADEVEAAGELRAEGAGARCTAVTPEPPGPPGLITSEPIRALGSVASRRATASSNVSPRGFVQSTGTVSVPHSAVASSAHGAQVMARAPAAAGVRASRGKSTVSKEVRIRTGFRTAKSNRREP
jgi:hypothetical protein